jgi:predicted DNA repair protein MutK
MAGSSFFALFDDIAALLDDIALMSKVAAKKTAGVLGDDLALNAQQVTGVNADRELPVVWAVAKGSLLNKCILVPAALAISALIPWLITPLLMLGGAYLCFEGAEKVLHALFHKDDKKAHQAEVVKAVADESVDLVAFESNKIKGAIRTDFILSAEIIVIVLGTTTDAEALFRVQALVLCVVAFFLTVGVYGAVAAIVRMDDAGLYLIQKTNSLARKLGQFLLWAAPKLMHFLSVFGTAAMFLVGGGILIHGIPFAAEQMHHIEEWAQHLPVAWLLGLILPAVVTGVLGFLAGGLVVAVVEGVGFFRRKKAS